MPLNRLMDVPPLPKLGLAPLARATYETQVWPLPWLTSLPADYWPHRVNDLRLLLAMSSKLKGRSENFYLGPLLEHDFSRSSPIQSWGYGAEVGAGGNWRFKMVGFKLDTSLRQLFPITSAESGRMGLIWLVDGKIESPIYRGISISTLANFALGTMMNNPTRAATSFIFGFALSYSDYFKLLL